MYLQNGRLRLFAGLISLLSIAVFGTPAQMYDEQGNLTWEADLDIYGKVRNFAGRSLNECPFRWQGQYFDEEVNLYYNRFRYYDPDTGNYISQDPIGLAGNNPTLYGYVHDPNSWIDVFGLELVNGVPQNPGVVRRFMSKTEYKEFRKNGFRFDPTDSRGGISATSTSVKPQNPDAIKRSTGALSADYYVDIDTRGKNVELKGKTKGGVMDWKIKDDVSVSDIVGSGKVCK
jgi:RHS repeat-associated protein